MTINDLNKNLDKFLNISAESVLAAMGKDRVAKVALWPIPTPQGVLYWGEAWAEKLNHVLHAIENQGINKEEVAKAIKFPSRIIHILWRTDALQKSTLSKKERLYTLKALFNYLAFFRKQDIFCENSKNIIWSKKQLKDNKKGLSFLSIDDKETGKLLSKLETSLFLYTELIYWANHPIGHSFHGPYKSQEG